MKKLTQYFNNKNIIFKELYTIEPKVLKSRKKLEIYTGTGIDSNYYAIFIIDAKSRFLKKNANDLIELYDKLVLKKEHNFKKKILLISSPLCSKAKKFLEDNSWSVKNDFM